MKLYFDLHTHSIMSTHAYSTIEENIKAALEKGLYAYGISDHSYMIKGGANEVYFRNFKAVPTEINGMKILTGAEINILDLDGEMDLTEKMEDALDFIIVSAHTPLLTPGTKEENTECYIKIMQNPRIKIIGHPDDSRVEVDYERLAKEAKRTETVLELNNSSLTPLGHRINARENISEMLKYAEKFGTRIVVNSDAHFSTYVGNFQYALEILKECNFPEELVVNSCPDGLKYVINESERTINMF